MLNSSQYRLLSRKKLASLGLCAVTVILTGISVVYLKAAQIEEQISPPTERVAEEVDIFKERARELAREERREQKLNKKKKRDKKAPPTVSNWYKFSSVAPTEVENGWGNIGRASHLANQTFGRYDSITPLETMPYILSDEHFIFSDVRGFISNRSQPGGSGGVGYRYLRTDWNAWGGASLWYDGDRSTSKYYQQLGLSLEALVQRFELRSNVYFPISTTSQTISNTVGDAAIVGNQLLYGRNINQGYAMQGVDYEVGYSLPIRERHVIRAFVGGYHFNSNTAGSVEGVKVRVEGVYNNGPSAQVLYTSDKLFGDNLMVGVTLQFPFGNNHPTSGWKKNTPSPFRFVERNYNVIVDQVRTSLGDQVATDPTTGNPYVVEQVYSPAPGGPTPSYVQNGTSDAPYSSIAAAQAAGGNLIIVQGGSVISTPVTLASGQRLIGQGSYTESIAVQGGGFVKLPSIPQSAEQGNPAQTPIFSNVTGTAVTLASNSEVSGFTFTGSSGDAIGGNNVNNTSLHDLKFLASTGDAINLQNSTGTITLYNDQVTGATGDGIVINGGNANINYDGTNTFITAQGNGFVLENLSGGTVNINNLTVKGTGGTGLMLSSVGTDVNIASYTASQTSGPAVAISGDTGQVETVNGKSTNVYDTYNFNGYTTITSPKGAGFTINGTDAIINVANLNVVSTAGSPAVSLINDPYSAVTFGTMTLNTNGGTSLYAQGMAGLVINGGTINALNAPAIQILNSAINTSFTSVSADGGTYGISIVQSTGIFNINGTGSLGSGGTIQNTTTGLLLNSFGTSNINWVNFASNGTAVKSTASGQLALTGLQIAGSGGYAISSTDDATLAVQNSSFASNGSVGGGTILIQSDVVGTFHSILSGNTIVDSSGTAVQYTTLPNAVGASLATTIQSNTITGYAGNSSLIGMNWNGPASIAVTNNTMYAYGSSMYGLQIQDPSTTQSVALTAQANTITFEAGASQGTGIAVTSANTSQMSVAQNNITFDATAGIGLHFSLAGTSTDYIASNVISDTAGGATGMLFDTVAANSRLQIDGNTINLLSSDLTTHQGIIFTQVTPTIQFTGSVNNLIYNTTSEQALFSIPVNSATGGFYINGSLVQ